MAMLKTAFARVRSAGWRLVNLDCTVCCEQPRILPFREKIRYALAQALDVQVDTVFVKGKTAEGLGPVGRGRAVEAAAICLLEKEDEHGRSGGS